MEMMYCNPAVKTCRKAGEKETRRGGMLQEQVSAASQEEILSAWYDEYGTDILRYCFLFLGNKSDAEDATQETFLKVWKNIGRFEAQNGCSPKTWIVRIAGNTCRDYLRKAWRRHEKTLIGPEDLARLGSAPEEDRELVMDIMNLPEEYRQVILLIYWQGMTIRETAQYMHTSGTTVTRRLEKARKMIA